MITPEEKLPYRKILKYLYQLPFSITCKDADYQKVAKEIARLIPEESECDNLPKMANKRIGSDFNEFYIEALEATILDLTGKSPEDKEKLETQIAKRKIEEAVKDLTKDGRFQWRDGQVYAEEILEWLDQGGQVDRPTGRMVSDVSQAYNEIQKPRGTGGTGIQAGTPVGMV